MGLGSLVSRVLPAAVGFVTGGPAGAVSAAIATEQGKKQERKVKQAVARQQEKIQESYMAIPGFTMGSGEFGAIQSQAQPVGFFDRLTSFGSNLGNTVLTGLETALPSVITGKILGQRPVNVGQQPALTTVTNIGAQESQGSGSIQAGAGALLPGIVSGARALLKSPAGQLALGGGVGLATSMLGADGKPMRVTRKMRSELKSLLRMTNNNYALVGDFLNLNQEQMLFILNKRFRNDGPVVTKAALRKTKQTVRRLKSMCDMYDSLRPTARRRTPMKRASSTTLIKN